MTDVFNDDDSGTTRQEQIEKYFDHLVGEDKKFKSPEELAKGKWEADNYISTLEKQMDALRTELDKRETADEIADRIRSQLADRTPSNSQSNQSGGENGADSDDQTQTTQGFDGLSKEDLIKLLDERLDQKDKLSKSQRNRQEVSKVLDEKIGATAKKFLQDKAVELGVTLEYLQQQAEVSPKAFYNLVGLNQQGTQQRGFTPPGSSVNTATLDSGSQVRNNAYYEKMFKDNPKLKFDPKVTVQMHKDAQKMGLEKFYG